VQARNKIQLNLTVFSCWVDADKGDSLDLKVHFIGNGSLIQYDENKVKNKNTPLVYGRSAREANI
jgi:hypothetical protein